MFLMVRSLGNVLFSSIFFFLKEKNKTSELISVLTIDLSYCTFDFPCKKEDLFKDVWKLLLASAKV